MPGQGESQAGSGVASMHAENDPPAPLDVDEDGIFYEVEKIMGKRKSRGRTEYLVKWKGYAEAHNTWEAVGNLCESAYQEAMQFSKNERNRKRKAELSLRDLYEEDSRRVATEEDREATQWSDGTRNESASAEQPSNPHMHRLKFREVQKYDAQSLETPALVQEAREHGTPFILYNHRRWPIFTDRWLRRKPHKDGARPAVAPPSPSSTLRAPGVTDVNNSNDDDSDDAMPSAQYEVNVNAMIRHIGDELVPILRHDYNETEPIKHTIEAAHFLQNFWPKHDNDARDTEAPRNYLHQWQFPLSPTASYKLCRTPTCDPLPNKILGQDLLTYWLESKVNPFQYIFMGDVDTASKLHADSGGLDILIAPVVGKKECHLMHKVDGDRFACGYDADLSTGYVDANKHPRSQFARVWKTVVSPGEILFLPQGTHHQCKNIEPCLSYSRFHLDTRNIQGFVDSMFEDDAPEIDHDQVIWNCIADLTNYVLVFEERFQAMSDEEKQALKIPTEFYQHIADLGVLRHICKDVIQRMRNMPRKSTLRKEWRNWTKLLKDIDNCLSLVA